MPSSDLIVPTNFLEPDTISLGTLFSKGPYAIPVYQRDYKWKEENVSQLWGIFLRLPIGRLIQRVIW
jgi:hypothetical protein